MVHDISSVDDIAPLLEGLAIVRTGGGGSALWGKSILEHDFRVGRFPKLIPIEEIPDEALVVSDGFMGSVKVLEGIGIDEGEHEIGVKCVAAPIWNHPDMAVAAMSVSGPGDRIDLLMREHDLMDRVRAAGNQASANLGYSGPRSSDPLGLKATPL